MAEQINEKAQAIAGTVPAIRFEGFSGEWDVRELDSVVDFYSGLTYSPSDVVKSHGTFVLRSSNVKGGEIVDADNVYVRSKVVNSENVRVGDIVVVVRNGSRSLIGKHAQIKVKMLNTVIGAFMTGIHSEQPAFVNALLDTHQFNSEIEKNLGATINQITTGAFKKMQFGFSNPEEQTQIGNFFQQLDGLIAQHQQKHDKLLTIKKALLEKMFPQQGDTQPQIRFKGFSGAWEEKALGNVTDVYDGTHQTPKYTSSGVMFLSVENIKTLQSKKYISLESFEKDFKVYPRKNDVLMTRIGDVGTANVVESDTPKAYYVTLALLKYKSLDPYYLKASLSSDSVKKEVWHRTLHIAFPKKINMNEIAKVAIHIPSSNQEQTKIGILFQQLDTLINQHQSQLTKLNNIKQSFLSKMFV